MRGFLVGLCGTAAACGFMACSDDPAADPDTPVDASIADATPSDGPASDAAIGDADGASPSTVAFFKSGSRLKATSFRVEGESYFQWFNDTALGVQCNLIRTSATTAVCVPISTVAVFADAACTSRAALRPPSCEGAPRYALEARYACGYATELTVYPLGAALPGTAYYAGAACVENATLEGDLLSLGDPIPSEGLVSFLASTEPASVELSRVRWVGSDGSEWVDDVSLYDDLHARTCGGANVGLEGAGGQTTRCIPGARAVHRGGPNGDGPFLDASCSEPAADFGLDQACGQPEIALRRTLHPDAGACNAFYFVPFEVGEVVTTSYQLLGDTCTPATPSNGRTAWTLGATVAESSFPSLTLAQQGSGRVQARARFSQGVRLNGGAPFDSLAGDTCAPRTIHGETYCVGRVVDIAEDTYADPTCTQHAVLGATSCFGPPPPQPQAAWVQTPGPDGCGSDVVEVHTLTPVADPATLYRREGDACVAEGPAEKVYAVGGVVEPATVFPKGILVTD